MQITEIQTFLVNAAPPQEGGWEARNWLFVKVLTDEGIYGVGEASGWPRVVQTAIARVADAVDIPIAAGERHAGIWGAKELIEREIIDVVQPDTGRAGGLGQMRKIAAMAEAHYISMAPHDGSLGPIAEIAAVHLMATLPNFLILEHLEDDVPQRYEVMDLQPKVVNSFMEVPNVPGLGVDIVEEACVKYPSEGNVSDPEDTYDYAYVAARTQRATWLSTQETERSNYRPGSIY